MEKDFEIKTKAERIELKTIIETVGFVDVFSILAEICNDNAKLIEASEGESVVAAEWRGKQYLFELLEKNSI